MSSQQELFGSKYWGGGFIVINWFWECCDCLSEGTEFFTADKEAAAARWHEKRQEYAEVRLSYTSAYLYCTSTMIVSVVLHERLVWLLSAFLTIGGAVLPEIDYLFQYSLINYK